jgi:rhodanese-related sulfurtransferase
LLSSLCHHPLPLRQVSNNMATLMEHYTGRQYLLIVLILFFYSPEALAQEEQYQKITAPEVQGMMQNKDVMIINTLSNLEYELQHIPGSISIPINTLRTPGILPANKNTPLIFYCMANLCPYSERAARFAIEQGYKEVFWFQGGINEWRSFNYPLDIQNKYKDIKPRKISPSQVAEHLLQPDTFLLDVRPQDYSKGPEFIKEAYHCPLLNLTERIHDLPKDKKIIVSDWKMQQSPLAAKYLIAHDFNVIGVVRGGTMRWVSEKLPIETRSIKSDTPR